ncbi:unnamed protein product, partial [marine sediment metagenome]
MKTSVFPDAIEKNSVKYLDNSLLTLDAISNSYLFESIHYG